MNPLGQRSGTPLLLGVVHLAPLPGSPRYGGDPAAIAERALRDTEAYLEGGLDGCVVENFGDTPFRKDQVENSVIAEMAVITRSIVELAGHDATIGVNVLRNDASAALAIAHAAGARFIRVNVHLHAFFTDQGVIEGKAWRTLRERRALAADIAILADVCVKHAVPPPGFDLEAAARDLIARGHADGLIVTGNATGSPVSHEELGRIRAVAPEHPLFAGSGVTPQNIASILEMANGVIVGTALKRDGRVEEPVDRHRVEELVRAAGRSPEA